MKDIERSVIWKMRRGDVRRESDDTDHTVDCQYSRKVLIYCKTQFPLPNALQVAVYFLTCNVPVYFTFVFVAVVISREWRVVRNHFSSLMSPFHSRVADWKIPNRAATMCQITSVVDLIRLSSPGNEKKPVSLCRKKRSRQSVYAINFSISFIIIS